MVIEGVRGATEDFLARFGKVAESIGQEVSLIVAEVHNSAR